MATLGATGLLELVESIRAYRLCPALSVALPLSLHALRIPRPGSYTFELLIDAVHYSSVGFVAELGQPAGS